MGPEEIRAHVDPMRDEFAEERSLVLPALKFAQTEKGYLTRSDLAAVAEAVHLTPAYVESVASFYDRLYLRPTGTRVISNAGGFSSSTAAVRRRRNASSRNAPGSGIMMS